MSNKYRQPDEICIINTGLWASQVIGCQATTASDHPGFVLLKKKLNEKPD